MSSIKIAINKYKVKGYTQFNNTHNIFTQVGSLSVYFFFHLKALHSFRRRLKKKKRKYIPYPFHYRMAFAFYVILLPLIDNLLYSKSCFILGPPRQVSFTLTIGITLFPNKNALP